MEVELYEGIEPDPSVETVMKGAAAMARFQPDWIIAMGGGSPIDAAKAMWIKYEYPECTFEDMCKVFGLPKLRRKAHFCAVSSTSGTATEVTAFSIITDYSKGIKYPIADLKSRRTWPSSIRSWRRPCPRSWLRTPAWTR